MGTIQSHPVVPDGTKLLRAAEGCAASAMWHTHGALSPVGGPATASKPPLAARRRAVGKLFSQQQPVDGSPCAPAHTPPPHHASRLPPPPLPARRPAQAPTGPAPLFSAFAASPLLWTLRQSDSPRKQNRLPPCVDRAAPAVDATSDSRGDDHADAAPAMHRNVVHDFPRTRQENRNVDHALHFLVASLCRRTGQPLGKVLGILR